MVNVLTSNRYTATVHRVIHRGEIPRISIPFFFEPSFSVNVKPIPAFVPDHSTPQQEVNYYEHMCHML